MTLTKYIINESTKASHFSISNIEIFIKDTVQNPEVSVNRAIKTVVSKVPSHLMKKIKQIHVGQFEFLNSKDYEASYQNSKIFVTNEQSCEEDMIDDIIHEVAHSVEELYTDFLYSDKSIEKEFLAKRKNMWNVLRSKGTILSLSDFLNVRYNQGLDKILYRDIGYPVLSVLTASIFHSPYAATSLSEYFADGFEAFYMKEELGRLKNISPRLYNKIVGLSTINTGGYND